jgi:hypothetical protein
MAQLTIDQLGWGYISIFIVWNVALAVGVTFLWTHRGMPSVRMRRVPLLLAGIIPLHIFGSLCVTAYPIGAVAFPCVFEFWYVNNPSQILQRWSVTLTSHRFMVSIYLYTPDETCTKLYFYLLEHLLTARYCSLSCSEQPVLAFG